MPPKDFPATLWGRLAERYGIPSILLGLLLWWGGNVSDQAARWVATEVAAPLIKTHVETMQTLQDTQKEIVKAQKETTRAVGQIERSIERCCGDQRPTASTTAVASPKQE